MPRIPDPGLGCRGGRSTARLELEPSDLEPAIRGLVQMRSRALGRGSWSPLHPTPRQYAHPVAVRITWQQALAWRMRRHLLDPIGRLAVTDVVDRLCGVQA